MAAQAITSKDINALTGRTYPAIEPGAPLLAGSAAAGTWYAQHRLYRETVAALAELDDRSWPTSGSAGIRSTRSRER